VKEDAFSFPVPSSDLKADGSFSSGGYVTLDGVDIGYESKEQRVLLVEKITATLGKGSRVAVCGDNGCGKTTLMKVIAEMIPPLTDLSSTGGTLTLKRHPKMRVAYVSQDHAKALYEQDNDDSSSTAAAYLARRFKVSELEARSKLGKFGIASTAKVPLKRLSGGQKARLSLAALTWQEPHLLLLDEPTNHLDMPALDALAAAVEAFQGAVVVVSHNRAFLSACCNQLWTIEAEKQLRVYENADFNVLFAAYADRVLGSTTGGLTTNGGRLSAEASRLTRRADALDAKNTTTKKKSSSAKQKGQAGAAATNRSALI